MTNKLKVREVKAYRAQLLAKQAGRCPMCQRTIAEKDAVLDHDHTTGRVRGVLHRGCNSLLGKAENNYRRYGMSRPQLYSWAKGLPAYLQEDYRHHPLHPTHKTDEERRLARNAKARKRYAERKRHG